MNANLQMLRRSPSAEQLKLQNLRLRVGDYAVDVGALRVIGAGEASRLTSKAVAVLLELVRQAGNTVSREDLLETAWKDRVTTPDVLTQAIKELRRAFADGDKPARYIETIPKVGYRLLAEVAVIEAGEIPFGRVEHMPLRAENESWVEPNGDEAAAFALAAAARALATNTDAEEAAEPVLATVPPAPVMPTRRWMRYALALAALLAAAVAVVWYVARPGLSPVRQAWHANNIRAVTSDPGPELRPRISPDGTRMAFGKLVKESGFDRLYIRAMEPSQLVELEPNTENAHDALPVWSPDGSRIVYERLGKDKCTLYVVASLGGREREIGDCQDFTTSYFDFTPDGQELVTALRLDGPQSDLSLILWNLASGVKQPLHYARAPGDQDLEPHYSPDGRWIAFRRGVAPYSDLYLMRADGSDVRQLTHLSGRIRGYTWAADSSALVFSSSHQGRFELYAADIADGHVQRLGVESARYPSAARSSTSVVYEISRTTNTLAEIDLDQPKSPPRKLAASTGSDSSPALSPDGKFVAFLSDRSGSSELWLYDRSTDSAYALTDYRNTIVSNPVWRADSGALLVGVHEAESVSRLVEIDLASRRERAISARDENVLFGSYGLQADDILLAVGTSSNGARLLRRVHAGSPKQADHLLASSVHHAEVDVAHAQVYYTRIGSAGLFRRDLDGGEEQKLSGKITSVTVDGWRLVGDKIWYIPAVAARSTVLREFDPATGGDRLVADLQIEISDLNFSVSADAKRVYLAPVANEDTDVGTFELERASTR